jgi:hypothetical protein
MNENETSWTRRDFVTRLGGAAVGLAAAGLSAPPALAGRSNGGAGRVSAAVPTAWFDLSLDLVRSASGFSPPVAARAFAYAGLTLYEAVVPGMRGYRSLARVFRDLDGLPRADRTKRYDWPTVANAALAAILESLIPTAGDAELDALTALETRFLRRRGRMVPPAVLARSVERGLDVAETIFAWSRGDGGHQGYLRNFPPYSPPAGPGLWVPTPPAFSSALQPFWGGNRCLAITNGARTRPATIRPTRRRRARGSGGRRARSTIPSTR